MQKTQITVTIQRGATALTFTVNFNTSQFDEVTDEIAACRTPEQLNDLARNGVITIC